MDVARLLAACGYGLVLAAVGVTAGLTAGALTLPATGPLARVGAAALRVPTPWVGLVGVLGLWGAWRLLLG